MFSSNPFPESYEKKYLRRLHLRDLSNHKQKLGRDLIYFGLPSSEMIDVDLWKSVLARIIAIEREPEAALSMYRTAELIGIRSKTIIIENDLAEVIKLLALDVGTADASLSRLSLPERNKMQCAKEKGYDIVNLDYCGGFLYPKNDGDTENSKVLKDLVAFQAKHRQPFFLYLTFNLRDAGVRHYDNFINESFSILNSIGVDATDVERFYTATGKVKGQPQNLRKLRFCVPVYIHKIAYDNFTVKIVGAWYYKTFYHAALYFEPRVGLNSLGCPWPPINEFKEIIQSKLIQLKADEDSNIDQVELPAPFLL